MHAVLKLKVVFQKLNYVLEIKRQIPYLKSPLLNEDLSYKTDTRQIYIFEIYLEKKKILQLNIQDRFLVIL